MDLKQVILIIISDVASSENSYSKFTQEKEKWENVDFWQDKEGFQEQHNDSFFRFMKQFWMEGENFEFAKSYESVRGEDVIVLVDLTLEDVVFGLETNVKYD